MVPHPAKTGRASSCFPRASGDGPYSDLEERYSKKFPPRERGWSPASRYAIACCSVSPARAGMVPIHSATALALPCFPRASGDGP